MFLAGTPNEFAETVRINFKLLSRSLEHTQEKNKLSQRVKPGGLNTKERKKQRERERGGRAAKAERYELQLNCANLLLGTTSKWQKTVRSRSIYKFVPYRYYAAAHALFRRKHLVAILVESDSQHCKLTRMLHTHTIFIVLINIETPTASNLSLTFWPIKCWQRNAFNVYRSAAA